MFSLLAAIFGKNLIPPHLRRLLFIAGIASVLWRLRKLYQAKQAALLEELQDVKAQISQHFKEEPRFIGVGIVPGAPFKLKMMVAPGAAAEFRQAMGDEIEGYPLIYVEMSPPKPLPEETLKPKTEANAVAAATGEK